MKILHRGRKIGVLTVLIELGIDKDSDSIAVPVAASAEYVKRKSLKKDYQLTDEQIDELNHMIHRVIGILIQNDFEITKRYQSNNSYSYYIRFIPTDLSGRKSEQSLEIQFEIRDHLVNNHVTDGWLGRNILVKAYYVGDRTCFDTDGVLVAIRDICDQVKRGDYSAFI